MTTFDGWEEQLYGCRLSYGQDSLAHFRTKGSKNGVRRFQNEDGSWTPLGLKERKAREGWGDGERKAAKKEAKAQRKAARAEKVKEAREKRRKSNVKTMTDEELQAAIARKKMEMEYRELNKSPLVKTGAKLVTSYLEYRGTKEKAENERRRMALESKKLDTEVVKAKEGVKRTRHEAEKAKYEMGKVQADVAGGLKIARKAELKQKKIDWKGTTLHGNLIRALGTKWNAGRKDKYETIRKAEGKVRAQEILNGPQQAASKKAAKQQQKMQRKQNRQAARQQRRTQRLVNYYSPNSLN